eukprot:TRINITY_DN44440_c0_g1_i1.p1 TRINITY_DN44440_c0_g1~~TRINITY_DN44440_c0_g1_i1.p1  ORF type:complete len:168 (+),score=71.26 TRINITY_DN44440_c0_g1_i1:3-506(+)
MLEAEVAEWEEVEGCTPGVEVEMKARVESLKMVLNPFKKMSLEDPVQEGRGMLASVVPPKHHDKQEKPGTNKQLRVTTAYRKITNLNTVPRVNVAAGTIALYTSTTSVYNAIITLRNDLRHYYNVLDTVTATEKSLAKLKKQVDDMTDTLPEGVRETVKGRYYPLFK